MRNFIFGRIGSSLIGSVQLCQDGTIFSHQGNANESYWEEIDGGFNFLNRGRRVTTTFKREGDLWIGDFYNGTWHRSFHFLKEFSSSWMGRIVEGRKLIYIIALGGFYRAMTKMLIRSLRTLGNYKGDIVVFSDVNEFQKEQVLVDLIKIDQFKNLKSPKLSLISRLDQLVNLQSYSRVLFLDCDILVFRDINCLFGGEGVNIAEHTSKFLKDDKELYHRFLTEEEIVRMDNDLAINGGIFCFDGSSFNQFDEDFVETIKTSKVFSKGVANWFNEESFLAKLKGLSRATCFSLNDINYGLRRQSNGDFILFHCMDKPEMMIVDYLNFIETDYLNKGKNL